MITLFTVFLTNIKTKWGKEPGKQPIDQILENKNPLRPKN